MLGRFGKLRNEMEFFRLLEDSDLTIAHIGILDENSNPIPNVRIELRYNNKVIAVGTTNSDGVATLKASPDYTYTAVISGDTIEPKIIENFSIGDTQIEVEEKKYLELRPEYLFLNPYNSYKGDVEVMSNVVWNIN